MGTKPSKRESSLYLCSVGDEPDHMLEPLAGYASKPLRSLKEACSGLSVIIPQLDRLICEAQSKPQRVGDILTAEEAAAIRLYTMQSDVQRNGVNMSVYATLNRTLRDPDRTKLAPWMLYLKLLLTALTKLPPTTDKTVWRGVRFQDSTEYVVGVEKIWWGFSSCTHSVNVLESDSFLGQMGKRVLFSIETFDARSVKDYSDFPHEDEVLLLPGTCVRVHGKLKQASDLDVIQLKQVHPKQQLIERPFATNEPFTHTIAAGDTFWTLSAKYHCSVKDIAAMNPDVDCTQLQIGQVIRMPIDPLNAQPNMEVLDGGDAVLYVVCAQDTLQRIAERFHCTLDELCALNPDIRPDVIYRGQELRLPRNEHTRHIAEGAKK